ncbi:MAG: lysophospholipid acyltransferase family protein [Candidatus Enteromonas sp.]
MVKRDDKTKTIYYEDELNDDFMDIGLERKEVPQTYKYLRKNKFYNFFSNIFYFGIVKPILSVFSFFHGVRVENRKLLKEVKKEGAFIYANHTAAIDAFVIQTYVVRCKRTEIIGYSDSVHVPVLKHVGRCLGYLPLPVHDLKIAGKLVEAIDFYNKEKHHILIYPEAHIWPYYTDIRPFVSASFHYPAKLKAKVVPIVTTYRKVWYSKKPKMTLIVGKPIAPKEGATVHENREYLRNECYREMKEISDANRTIEYFHYVKTEKEEEKPEQSSC